MQIKFGRHWNRHIRRNKAYGSRFSLKRLSYRTKWKCPKTWSEVGIQYHPHDRGYY